MAASFAPGSRAGLSYLNKLLAARGVDTAAADAVFAQEGASGGIGDGGHAFGPGQFNDAGGVWTGRYQGLSPEQKNQAAWSVSGLRELADRVASVAAGLHGQQAITSIVSRFERPANPGKEIAGALASYGKPLAAGTSPLATLAARSSGGLNSGQIASLLAANEAVGLHTSPLLAQLLASKTGGGASSSSAPTTLSGLPGSQFLKLADGATLNGVDPNLVAAANALSKALGGGVAVTSGERNSAEQSRLYQRYLAGGNIAAKPGTSNHERGHALDLTYNGVPIGRTPAAKYLKRYGLHLSVPGDFPHVTLLGVNG